MGKTIDLKGKKRKKNDVLQKSKNDKKQRTRNHSGPELPAALRRELQILRPQKPKPNIDSDEDNGHLGDTVYEYDEPLPQEETKKNKRFDPVDNLEYELPESFQVSVEDVKVRQNRLAKMRSLPFHHELKAKHIKKIKSKTSRRLLRKDRLRHTSSEVSAICGAPRGPQKTEDPEVEKLLRERDAVKNALAAMGISYDQLINESVSQPNVARPVPDAGSGTHGIIDVGRGATPSVPVIASGSVAGSVSHSVPAVVSQSVPDEGINSQVHTLINKKVRLMHFNNHDITVAVGELKSTNPDDTVHSV